MQRLGFNVVRLGIEWQGLEPGTGGPNQPQICTPGTPGNPDEFNKAVADAYLKHVAATVQLLSRYGIYTLLDMHQDVYNSCSAGRARPTGPCVPTTCPSFPWADVGRTTTSNPQLDTAVGHFWANDVVGDLQGQFDLAWKTVADYFKDDPWVAGYDPYNEPFSTETQIGVRVDVHRSARVLLHRRGAHRLPGQRRNPAPVPADDPSNGVVASIQSVDHNHLIFVEPDIYWVPGGTFRRSWARCRSSVSSSTSTSTAGIGAQ